MFPVPAHAEGLGKHPLGAPAFPRVIDGGPEGFQRGHEVRAVRFMHGEAVAAALSAREASPNSLILGVE